MQEPAAVQAPAAVPAVQDWPTTTGPQVPLWAAPALTLQAWQSRVPPAQAVSQQTPSTQVCPVGQLAVAVQGEPWTGVSVNITIRTRSSS